MKIEQYIVGGINNLDVIITDPDVITVVGLLGNEPNLHPAITLITDKGLSHDNKRLEDNILRAYYYWGDALLVYCEEMGIATPDTMPEDREAGVKANFIKPGKKYYIRTNPVNKMKVRAFTREEVFYVDYGIRHGLNQRGSKKTEVFSKVVADAKKLGIEDAEILAAHMKAKYWYVQKAVKIKEEYQFFFFNTKEEDVFIYKKTKDGYIYPETNGKDIFKQKFGKTLRRIIKKAKEDNVVYFKLHFYVDTKGEFGILSLMSNLLLKDLPDLYDRIQALPTEAIVNVIKQINPYYATEGGKDV